MVKYHQRNIKSVFERLIKDEEVISKKKLIEISGG